MMKNFFLLLFCIVNQLNLIAQQRVFQFEGNYQGDNVFIQNPLSDSIGNYCTISILVNETIISTGFDMSAYEIRLDTLKLKIGDPVKVSISHWSDCSPKIINSIINPRPTFEIRKITIDSLGVLKWATEKESGKLMYTIQQFIWNKWITIGEMGGIGKATLNEYEFKTLLHSGINKFRVKQSDGNGKNYLSKTIEIDTKTNSPKLKSNYFNKSIEFGFETRYEIFDAKGNLLKKGFSDKILTEEFKKGNYYLNFDNVQTEVIKR